jgi:hypothetical protein
MSLDYRTPIGQMRSALGDTNVEDPLFSDPELQALLDLNEDNVFGAIADAFRRIASETALLYKVIRTDDLQVNGSQMAETFLKSAEKYDKKAERYEETGGLTLIDPGYSFG